MTSKRFPPLPLAGEGRGEGKPCERREGRGEGKPLWIAIAVVTALAGCGNYSNEDLEFMNAVPARQDFVASIKGAVMPANEAELAKDTHNVILVFNKALDFL